MAATPPRSSSAATASTHAELVVDGQRPVLEPEQTRGLLDREVGLLGGEDGAVRNELARGGQRRDRRDRGRVLDVAVKARRQAEELRHPVEDEVELGGGRPVCHTIVLTFSAAAMNSARMAGSDPLVEKYAKKRG